MEKWNEIFHESQRRLLDNAITENLFSILKRELIYQNNYKTRQQARQDIFEYIAAYYNRIRIYFTLQYKSPEDYENERKISKL